MTRKPCPGCGVRHSSRSADKVCYSCEALLEEARGHRQEERGGKKRPYYYTSVARWMKYYGATHLEFDRVRELQACMRDLVCAIVEKSSGKAFDYGEVPPLFSVGFDQGQYGMEIGLFDPKVAVALDRFDLFLRKLLTDVSYAGEDHGRDLLMQLNDGSLSMDDFLESGIQKGKHWAEKGASLLSAQVKHSREVKEAHQKLKKKG